MRFVLILLLSLLLPISANARLISYPGGVTAMTMNDIDSNALHLFYTPAPSYSVGMNLEYLRDADATIAAVQGNYLVKRWNMPGSQANAYVNAGAGAATADGETDPVVYAGSEIDWEDRRFFTLYQNRFLWADDTEKFAKHMARVGVTPYIGDYGDLHTWLMLQADYDAGEDDTFSLTPLVRLFKGTTLVEAGYNLDGGLLFNGMFVF